MTDFTVRRMLGPIITEMGGYDLLGGSIQFLTLNANANLYVSGSTNYLYIHGTNEAGEQVKFKVAVQGHILDISGSTS